MAVLQGVRLHPAAAPTSDIARGSHAAARAGSRSGSHVRPTGLVMAAILAATMLGLVYLTQTLGSNATNFEIRDLAARSTGLGRKLLNQAAIVELSTDPEEVEQRARELGLKPLKDVVVVSLP